MTGSIDRYIFVTFFPCSILPVMLLGQTAFFFFVIQKNCDRSVLPCVSSASPVFIEFTPRLVSPTAV